jgi:hypothetical protein
MHKAGALEVTERETETPARAPQRKPDARFLTQLIATRHGLMQTRAKKRTAPELGAAAYGRIGWMVVSGGKLNLKL